MNDRNTYLELLNKHKIPKDTFDVSTAKELVNQIYDEIDDEKLYIGLKDIEDNKIYADSSIVEFELKDFCPCEVMEMDCECEIYTKCRGYFNFNYTQLAYDIILFNSEKIKITYNRRFYDIKNIKIIDTIQENKLGLIKWMIKI